MAKWQAEIGNLDWRTRGNLYSKTIDELMVRPDSSPLEGAQFFRKVSSKADTYKEADTGRGLDIPGRNEDADRIPYVEQSTGFTKELTYINYRSAVRAERRLVEMDKHNAIMGMISGLPLSVDRKYEYLFWDIFNSGFATHTTGDGLNVFSASHLHEDQAAGTWDNLEAASDLGFSSLDNARVNMDNRVSDKGFPMPVQFKKLIVAPANRRKAMELQVAEKNPENALNQPNVFKNTWDVVVSHWLTDTNGYFLWGDVDGQSPNNGFVIAEQVAPMVETINPENPDILFSKLIRFSVIAGAVHSKMCHGSAGS